MKVQNLISQLLGYFTKDIENMNHYGKLLQQQVQSYLNAGQINSYKANLAQVNYVQNRIRQARSFLNVFKLIFKNKDLYKEISELITNENEILILEKHEKPKKFLEIKEEKLKDDNFILEKRNWLENKRF